MFTGMIYRNLPHNWGHIHFSENFKWWAIKHFAGFDDKSQAESDDVVDMLCMGGEL